jgi:hypothetical protein
MRVISFGQLSLKPAFITKHGMLPVGYIVEKIYPADDATGVKPNWYRMEIQEEDSAPLFIIRGN